LGSGGNGGRFISTYGTKVMARNTASLRGVLEEYERKQDMDINGRKMKKKPTSTLELREREARQSSRPHTKVR
jgi:hypothetical protein